MAAEPVAPPQSVPPPGILPKSSLYVGDLHPEVTEMDLAEAFRPMGSLASVRLCRDKLSQQSLRYAYINFFSPSDASKALTSLNHTELKGYPMRIMWCQRDPLTRKTGVGNLFVKNLDPSVTSARLQGIFCKFGTILSCKVVEEHGKSKGFGFVQFDSEDSSMAAVNSLHGSVLEGKKLYVSKFVKKSERIHTYEELKFTNLYVKNLGEYVTEDILKEKFSEFGKVRKVLIIKDTEGKSRGFGFINFESHEEAEKAVEALNGAMLGSEKLFVGKAQKKAEREEFLKHENNKITNCHTKRRKASNLYVKNIDASIDDGKLREHFSVYGNVTSAKVMRCNNGISKGFGFVSFFTPEEAKKALDALHGTKFQGKSLFVAMAQSKEERHRELQNYYAKHPLQSFYCSESDLPTHGFHQTYYTSPPFPTPNPVSWVNSHLPLMHEHFGRSEDALSSITPMGFPDSNVPTRGLNYGSYKDQNISWDNRSRAAEASFRGNVATKGLAPASTLGTCKQNFRGRLYPMIENLQPGNLAKKTGALLEMKRSDAHKLLSSRKSLAVQVEKVVQVLKDANSRAIVDGHVAQPAKSAHCLSY
ncbi:hypothetical protein U1Q18_006502 [Sarracenia purpurea var. burkii]